MTEKGTGKRQKVEKMKVPSRGKIKERTPAT